MASIGPETAHSVRNSAPNGRNSGRHGRDFGCLDDFPEPADQDLAVSKADLGSRLGCGVMSSGILFRQFMPALIPPSREGVFHGAEPWTGDAHGGVWQLETRLGPCLQRHGAGWT
jgi:hypothetical protein